MGHPLTTAYTTLGPEGLQHSLDQPSCEMVFTNATLLPTLASVLDKTPSVKWVVYDVAGEQPADGKVVDKIRRVLEGRGEGARIVELEEVLRMGKEKPVGLDGFGERPKPDDVFCIMVSPAVNCPFVDRGISF